MQLVSLGVASAQTQTYTESVLYTFNCGQNNGVTTCPNGAQPYAAPIQARDGNFYGTTTGGGDATAPGRWGTVFKITPDGTFSTLYSFCGQFATSLSCPDGAYPTGLVEGSDGSFYGTTEAGGTGNSANCVLNGQQGFCGTIFKITPDGTLTTLYNFCALGGANCADGFYSGGGLMEGRDGNLYGTTYAGGSSVQASGGTVFKITPSGTLTTIYNFCSLGGASCTDGAELVSGLIQGRDGDFYGSTGVGGAAGMGTIFKITSSGSLSTLYSFCTPNCGSGVGASNLTQGLDGNFYGTTFLFGAYGGGTAFKITPAGAFTLLYTFCSQGGTSCTDGAGPGSLVRGPEGDFYGAAQGGGSGGSATFFSGGGGTVFRITPSGTLTTLYTFCEGGNNCTDGIAPVGVLVGNDGSVFGAASLGGAVSGTVPGQGAIFRLALPRSDDKNRRDAR